MEKEKRLKQMKAYQKNNKDKIRKSKQKRYIENKGEILLKQKNYYEKNKEAILERSRINYKNKQKTYSTNKNLDLSKDEKRKRKNSRRNARNYPLKKECQICYSPEKLERHHWNYNKPLLVSTLCEECHEIQHIRNFGGSKFGQ